MVVDLLGFESLCHAHGLEYGFILGRSWRIYSVRARARRASACVFIIRYRFERKDGFEITDADHVAKYFCYIYIC